MNMDAKAKCHVSVILTMGDVGFFLDPPDAGPVKEGNCSAS